MRERVTSALAAAPTNTSAVVAALNQLCKEAPASLQTACAALVAAAALPGGQVLALRPGAVCARVGLCDASCAIPIAGSNTTGRLDMCSSTGIAPPGAAPFNASAPVNVTLAPGQCRSNANCPATGRWLCDLATNVTATCTCDGSSGLDTRCGRG